MLIPTNDVQAHPNCKKKGGGGGEHFAPGLSHLNLNVFFLNFYKSTHLAYSCGSFRNIHNLINAKSLCLLVDPSTLLFLLWPHHPSN